MAKYEDPEITSSHKHIKTTTTYRVTLSEIYLGARRTAPLQSRL